VQITPLQDGPQLGPGGSPAEPVSTAQRPAFDPLGNIYEITQAPPLTLRKIKRLEKWAIHAAARDIMPRERVATCFRVPIASTVDIWHHQDRQEAHYKGLAICGSVWMCPVCASKISERRRVELAAAIDRAAVLGLVPYLLTLTVKHHNGETLTALLDRFGKARRLMRNRTPWKAWAAAVGVVGSVRSLEVTHGVNGWHVHTHEILFTRPGQPLSAADVLPMWQSACLTAGLQRPDGHGVDIRAGNNEVGNYVSKWGMDSELTKSMSKRGRDGHRSPFDFLRDYLQHGDEADADLFREYAEQFKSKHQIVWSKGLRDLLGLDAEKSDLELAEEIEKGSLLLGSLSLDQWRSVLKYDKRGEVLLVAVQGGIEAVYSFIAGLQDSV